MRLIDADKLNRKDVNCANTPMNFIDTAPTVEAIPKADYENRLKTDMVAMLDKIRAEIAEYKDDKIIHAETNEMIDIVLEIIDRHLGSEVSICNEPQESEE